MELYAIVDCNNFYASCERAFKPKYEHVPIVNLSNGDGCIIARSNEAKALGIPMGALEFEYRDFFEKQGVIVCSSNYELYGDLSNRVMLTLQTFSPDIEIYSIDEAFLKFTGFELFNYDTIGKDICYKVKKWTGIPVSVGFAPTKTLAKVANKIAKKERTVGFKIIDTEEKRIDAIKSLPIEDVWGIGRQHANLLREQNIKTAFDFTQMKDKWVQKNMSIVGLRIKRELEGISCLELEEVQNKQSIATTRSFDKNHTDYDPIHERVSTFAVSCAEKLRKQESCCNALMVFIHTNGHRKDLPQYSQNIVIKLPYPTNSNIELVHFATKALEKIFKKGYAYKKAGVIVMNLTQQDNEQVKLFENSNPKHKALMQTVDKINQKMGKAKVKLACQDLKKTWIMRQEKLSPCYTTRLSDIIEIKC